MTPAIKVGDSLAFYPATHPSNPRREITGTVAAVNPDGTMNVSADGVLYGNVVIIAPDALHPVGAFVVTKPPEGTGATPQGTGPASNAAIAQAQAVAQAPQMADPPEPKGKRP